MLSVGARAETTGSLPGEQSREDGQARAFVRETCGRLEEMVTPCYAFDPRTVVSRYRELRGLLSTRLIVSLKANPDADLINGCAGAFVDGMEAASLNELRVMSRRSIEPIYVNNLAMDVDLMCAALAAHATLVIDSLDQSEVLLAQRGTSDVKPVLLRVNAAELGFRKMRRDHFGMTIADAVIAVERLTAAGVAVAGCHVFAGSNTFATAAGGIAQAMVSILKQIEARTATKLTFVNLGGGFGVDWQHQRDAIAEYSATLAGIQAEYQVAHEAGRAIFADAGIFVTRVIATKHLHGQTVIVCDGGMAQNFLLCQVGALVRRYAVPEVVAVGNQRRSRSIRPLLFVGSTCSQDDVIGGAPIGAVLPLVGDFVLFTRCGAYNRTYSMIDFLGSRRAGTYVGPSPAQA